MGIGQTIGTGGFISWFYAVIYVKIRRTCKNIVIRISVHLIGIIIMITGLYYLFASLLSPLSLVGLFFAFIGFFIFMIPIGVK
jgi:hypothetical protein